MAVFEYVLDYISCQRTFILWLMVVSWFVNRYNAAGKCSSVEQKSICSSEAMCMSICINNNRNRERADENSSARVKSNQSAGNADYAHDYYANEANVVANVHVNVHMYRNIAVQMVPRVVPMSDVEEKRASNMPTVNDPSTTVQAYTTIGNNCTPHPTERQPDCMMTHQPSILPSANPSAIHTHLPTGMSVSQRSTGIPSEEPSSQMPTGMPTDMPTDMPTVYSSTHRPSGIQVLTYIECVLSLSSSTTTTTTTDVERIDLRGVHVFFLAASKNMLACYVASDSTEVNSGGVVLRGVPASDPKAFVGCCILAVKLVMPRFEMKGAAVYICVSIASSVSWCSAMQYCNPEISSGPSCYENRSDMPYYCSFGMYNERSIGALSAKSSVCMAGNGPNCEPTLMPRMASSNRNVLSPPWEWRKKHPLSPPWEWRNKHPLMAPYNRKGEPLVPIQVQVPHIVQIVWKCGPTSSPSNIEIGILCLWQRVLPCIEEILVSSLRVSSEVCANVILASPKEGEVVVIPSRFPNPSESPSKEPCPIEGHSPVPSEVSLSPVTRVIPIFSPSFIPSGSAEIVLNYCPSDSPSEKCNRMSFGVPATIGTRLVKQVSDENPKLSFRGAPSMAPSMFPSGVPSNMPIVSSVVMVKVLSNVSSVAPSDLPSRVPSEEPSMKPSIVPIAVPSNVPSYVPSGIPSSVPSIDSSRVFSDIPSNDPSEVPSILPSREPSVNLSSGLDGDLSKVPREVPSVVPRSFPSLLSIVEPSPAPQSLSEAQVEASSLSEFMAPSVVPSVMPSKDPRPSVMPSMDPTQVPSVAPSLVPSLIPSVLPSLMPSPVPSPMPSPMPSPVPSPMPSPVPSLLPSVAQGVARCEMPSEVPSEVPSVNPSEIPSKTPSVKPSNRQGGMASHLPSEAPSIAPSEVRVVLFCGDPTNCPTSDSIQNSIRNSNSYTNNEHSANIRGSPSSVPCMVPTNVPSPSREPSEYPAADRAAKCNEGSSDEPYITPTAVPSVYPTSKANSNPKFQLIQLLCMTPTVMPSIFHPIVPTSTQSQISLSSVKCGWFLCWWSQSGECFKFVCFIFYSCLTCVRRC